MSAAHELPQLTLPARRLLARLVAEGGTSVEDLTIDLLWSIDVVTKYAGELVDHGVAAWDHYGPDDDQVEIVPRIGCDLAEDAVDLVVAHYRPRQRPRARRLDSVRTLEAA
jgi:hypothetical protein